MMLQWKARMISIIACKVVQPASTWMMSSPNWYTFLRSMSLLSQFHPLSMDGAVLDLKDWYLPGCVKWISLHLPIHPSMFMGGDGCHRWHCSTMHCQQKKECMASFKNRSSLRHLGDSSNSWWCPTPMTYYVWPKYRYTNLAKASTPFFGYPAHSVLLKNKEARGQTESLLI